MSPARPEPADPFGAPLADPGPPAPLAVGALARALAGYAAVADEALLVVTLAGESLRSEVRWANRAATQLLGRALVDLVGCSLSSLAVPGRRRGGPGATHSEAVPAGPAMKRPLKPEEQRIWTMVAPEERPSTRRRPTAAPGVAGSAAKTILLPSGL